MKVCLLCVEVFAWGKYGGFGRATRLLGRELVRRGIEVCAVVPMRGNQRPVEELDGMTVFGFPMARPVAMLPILRACGADVYHSQHPNLGTFLAVRALPHKRHIVTFRDPKDSRDWWLELAHPSVSRLRVALNWAYEDSPAIRWSIRRMDGRFCAAACLNEKVQRIYRLEEPLETLPTPVLIPSRVEKSSTPLVAFVGRWDRRKRPERFFELAKQFPDVGFVAVGSSQDAAWERELRSRYGGLANLEMLGFVDQFSSHTLFELLGKSWILVNTAVREGLPTSFLEAMAHRCAILSFVNPDDIAARFGYHASRADFGDGLRWLLEGERWRARGEQACEYVRQTFELQRVVDEHVSIYERLVSSPSLASGRGG